jgi:hypothetical protein
MLESPRIGIARREAARYLSLRKPASRGRIRDASMPKLSTRRFMSDLQTVSVRRAVLPLG